MKKLGLLCLIISLLCGCETSKKISMVKSNSWLFLFIDAEKKRFNYVDTVNSYLGIQCDTANMKNHIDKVCCKDNLLWGFERYALFTKRLRVLDSLFVTNYTVAETDTINLFECYEDEGTYDVLMWNTKESNFVHLTNNTTTIVYKERTTLEEKRINLARDYAENSPDIDTVNLNKNFYDWIKISKNQPCEAVYTPSNLYYYTIFAKDKKTKKYNCIEAILFEN